MVVQNLDSRGVNHTGKPGVKLAEGKPVSIGDPAEHLFQIALILHGFVLFGFFRVSEGNHGVGVVWGNSPER